MKRFIIHSLFFCIILPSILFVVDLGFSPLLLQRQENNSVWYEIYHNNTNCEVAFFGSSRCLLYFDSDIVEKSLGKSCYNYGISNAKIDISCLCLEYLLQHVNQTPKYITLEVGYLTLNNDTIFDHHYQLYPLIFLNPSYFNYIHKYNGFDSKQVWIPLWRYSGYIGTMLKGAIPNNKLHKGFFPADAEWGYSQLGARNNNNSSFQLDSTKIEFLDRFVSLCEKNFIKLNFIYVPEHTDYKLFYNNKDEIVGFFKEYAHNKGIPFKDFSTDTTFNSDTTNFFNIEHVNKHGAEKFTRDYFVPYFKQLYNF
ncbi:MAG: hypothetical protein J6Z01_07035 [Bacteroidales bacterium]|nr:hypothetical protein [Bacteroidales bacterium]